MTSQMYRGVPVVRQPVSTLKTPMWKFVLPNPPHSSYLYSYAKTLRAAKSKIDKNLGAPA